MANIARKLSFKEPTLEEAKVYIESLDLTHVIQRVMKEKRWNKRMAEVAAKFYKHFLFISKKYPQYFLAPTEQIDEIWHAHILYTKEYHEMCEKVFGFYLHHQPTHEGEKNSDEMEDNNLLIKLHLEEFGYPIYDAVYSLKDMAFFIADMPKRLFK